MYLTWLRVGLQKILEELTDIFKLQAKYSLFEMLEIKSVLGLGSFPNFGIFASSQWMQV